MPDPRDLSDVADVLDAPRRVAVLGAHSQRVRPAYYVPAYLFDHGWTVLSANPRQVGQSLFGHPVVATLAEVDPVDVVCVFRRSDALAGHLEELRDSGAPVVWFQQGIRDDAVAASLRGSGIRVVQDRCMLADHRRLFGAAAG